MTTASNAHLVWYCRICRHAARVEPVDPDFRPGCQCEHPVLPLLPTEVAACVTAPTRRLQVLTDEEARRRAIGRKGTRVRVTYEAEVTQAWTCADADGVKRVRYMVIAPDGSRHAVDPTLPGVHVEGIEAEEGQ